MSHPGRKRTRLDGPDEHYGLIETQSKEMDPGAAGAFIITLYTDALNSRHLV